MFSNDIVAVTQAHLMAAQTFLQTDKLEEAIVSLRAAMALMPVLPEPHYHLGQTLERLGRMDEAIAEYRLAGQHAANQKRSYPESYVAQARAHMRGGDFAAALPVMQKALTFDKENSILRAEMAQILIQIGRPKAAAMICTETMRMHPGDADAHTMHALALLAQGRLKQGFAEYAWRWKTAHFANTALHTGKPVWQGEDIAGKTILVHAEQGAGDTIQFARFMTGLAAQGAQVMAIMPQPLVRLMATVPGVAKVHDLADPDLPSHDFVAPVMDLARFALAEGGDIPASVPYVELPIKYTAHIGVLRVGLVWAGNPGHTLYRVRSILNGSLRDLSGIVGVDYVSLQQDRTVPKPFPTIDEAGSFQDFAETAAVIDTLDLVISIDTSVAHLAGAMGKPVWTLLPAIADWRWGERGETTPWYPTMRLFRQAKPGDWSVPLTRIKDNLENLAAARMS